MDGKFKYRNPFSHRHSLHFVAVDHSPALYFAEPESLTFLRLNFTPSASISNGGKCLDKKIPLRASIMAQQLMMIGSDLLPLLGTFHSKVTNCK